MSLITIYDLLCQRQDRDIRIGKKRGILNNKNDTNLGW
jgi:hypothetical protein